MNTKFTKGPGRSMTTDEALLAAGRALEECLRIVNQPFELESPPWTK